MDASIVIRTKNEAASIAETLGRIEDQDFSGSYEVVVVDSGSTDSTLQIVKKYEVKLIQIPQKEFSYGRSLNVGADIAKGTYVVNLSAHAFPRDKGWLTNLIACFDEVDVAAVYGRQLSVGKLNPFEANKNEQFFGTEKIRVNIKDRGRLRRIHFSNSRSVS